jgi:competence protein ComEC
VARSAKTLGGLIIALLFGCAIVWVEVFTSSQKVLIVSFLDVGQGDSIFIESPSGVQVLIDGGPDRSVLRRLSSLMSWYDRSIDMVIATHPDADHVSGLVDVMQRYDVAFMVDSGIEKNTGPVESLLLSVSRVKTKHLVARRGQVFDLGGGVLLRILFPDRDVSGVETNTGSIVTQLEYGDTRFLLTGDAPSQVETYLASLDGASLATNVLKAGHHGSKTSSSALFVGLANPQYAIFSRGCNNKYGHPHAETVETFKQFEISMLDTCEHSTVTFISDGKEVSLK